MTDVLDGLLHPVAFEHVLRKAGKQHFAKRHDLLVFPLVIKIDFRLDAEKAASEVVSKMDALSPQVAVKGFTLGRDDGARLHP